MENLLGTKQQAELIIRQYADMIYCIACQNTASMQDAEDILQESFITALEKINTLDKSESFVGWFNRIVANKSKDFLKKKKPVPLDFGSGIAI